MDDAKPIDPVDDGLHTLEDRLQGNSLHTISTTFVKPASATSPENEWLLLCHLDYIWTAFYTPLVCTFTADQVRGSVVERLKESLAEALVLFYPLAGRLLMKDGPPRVHCNDGGAVFTEASVDVGLAELRTDDFVPVPLLSGLVAAGFDRYPTLPDLPDGLPALIVQVTHFKCGGIALAANWSHGVADGQSGLHFMKSWSEIARSADVSLLPVHNRTLLKPRDPPIPGELVKPVAVSPGAQAAAANRESTPSAEAEAKTEAKKPQIVTRTTEFTGDEIAAIRNAAGESGFTRADCLSTHIWRATARARERALDARVRLWILIEGRKKLGFPAGYFGNVVGITPVVTTARELLHGPLGATAALIHAGIASITGEWFQGCVDLMHVSAGKNFFTPEPLGPDSESGVSYLVRFPYYELDFGFGAPRFSMRNTMGAWDGLMFVLPSARGKDHMVVMPNLQPAALSNFITMAHDLPETKAEGETSVS